MAQPTPEPIGTGVNTIEEAIFHAASELKDAQARTAFLERACGADSILRARIENLLEADSRARQFLADNPLGLAPEVDHKDSQASAPPEEGPDVNIGRYKLLQKIGEGGMGVVYMAEQQEPVRRRVALKIIKLGMDTRQVVARFEVERQALALMDHPNIAQVFDGGATEEGRPYFVMELVQGVPITEFCDRNQFTTEARIQLFIPVCQAVQSAHQKGIIHRDLKPTNILVTLNAGVPVPKVIDFGVAKAINQRLTEKTLFTNYATLIGTPPYMSPEQAEMSSLDVDTRADVYGLGVLLYELLTGTTPVPEKRFRNASYSEMQRIILEEEPQRPSTRLSTLQSEQRSVIARNRGTSELTLGRVFPSDLDWIVMKCLEKDRTRRYETANGLAMDLQRHLNNDPVAARPPSAAYRVQKFVRRNKLLVSAGAAVATVMVAGVIVSAWQAIRATQAKANEAKQKQVAQQLLYTSLLDQARATRLAHSLGYRERVFDLLKQARGLDVPEKDLGDLRHEAVACLGDFVGLTPTTCADFPANSTIEDAALAPSGKLAAFGLSDSTIQLREMPSGKLLRTLKGTNGVFHAFWFNQTEDQLLAMCGPVGDEPAESLPKHVLYRWERDRDARWQRAEVRPVPGATIRWLDIRGEPVAMTLDVFRVDTAGNKGQRLGLMSLKTGAPIAGYGFTNALPRAKWRANHIVSPDGTLVADEASEREKPNSAHLTLYDWKNDRILDQNHVPIYGDLLSWSDDGKYLACLSQAGGVVFTVPHLEVVGQFSGNFEEPAQFAGNLVALPLKDQKRILLWNLTANREAGVFEEPGYARPVASSADGLSLLTVGSDHARLYRLSPPEKLNLPAHGGAVTGIAFSPDGAHLASVGHDRMIRVCDALTGGILWQTNDLPGPGQCVGYSPDGQWLATGDWSTALVCVWNALTGKRILKLGTNEVGPTCSAQFTPDGRYLVSLADGAAAQTRIWRIQQIEPDGTGSSILAAEPVKSFPGSGRSLAFATNGPFFVFNSENSLYLGSRDSLTQPFQLLPTEVRGGDECESFTPDGHRLVALGRDGEIVTIELPGGKVVSSFRTDEPEAGRTLPERQLLCLSPDGSMLALSSASGTGVDIWNAKAGRLLYSLPEEVGSVQRLVWSPDNRRLAVARDSGSIAIWNLEMVDHILTQLGLDR
jgi:WD40 repeat protein